MVASAGSFSSRIETRFFRSHDVKRHLDSSVMEYEERMIIKLLTNESVDAYKIHTRLSAQFGAPIYTLHMIQF
jgi:hypothetical protein